jgi:hypothetical protein
MELALAIISTSNLGMSLAEYFTEESRHESY